MLKELGEALVAYTVTSAVMVVVGAGIPTALAIGESEGSHAAYGAAAMMAIMVLWLVFRLLWGEDESDDLLRGLGLKK